MKIQNQVVIYKSKTGEFVINIDTKHDTVWLSQKQMASLFGKTIPTINEHIKNVYKEKELNTSRTIRKFRIVEDEGRRQITRTIDHFNLDVIISVGYRVKSLQGT